MKNKIDKYKAMDRHNTLSGKTLVVKVDSWLVVKKDDGKTAISVKVIDEETKMYGIYYINENKYGRKAMDDIGEKLGCETEVFYNEDEINKLTKDMSWKIQVEDWGGYKNNIFNIVVMEVVDSSGKVKDDITDIDIDGDVSEVNRKNSKEVKADGNVTTGRLKTGKVEDFDDFTDEERRLLKEIEELD
jgi:hypothetical protein